MKNHDEFIKIIIMNIALKEPLHVRLKHRRNSYSEQLRVRSLAQGHMD